MGGPWFQIAVTFGLISLISIGGANATIPEIHRQVVEVLHWMDDATFANLVAIGQSAPGPNVLIVSMIGWQVAGLGGLVLATFAIVLPSSALALATGRLLDRVPADRLKLVRTALAPLAVGFMLASGCVMIRAAFQGLVSLLIAAGAAAVLALTRRSPLFCIAAGAAIGIIGHRLHFFA